jgi:hypothetical protein
MDIVPKKEPLYLVVGSIRSDSVHKNVFPLAQLWQENKSDLSHKTTYKKKATTMDLEPCSLPEKRHIIGDARTYNFKDHIIKAAYLERLPTTDLYQNCICISAEKNYLGTCIQNIGNAMKQNAVMEIEWHPFVAMLAMHTDNIESIFHKKATQENPFTISIPIQTLCVAFELACEKTMSADFIEKMPAKFISCVTELSATFKKLLAFYVEKNVGPKELLMKRIDQELWLWEQLVLENKMALLTHGPAVSLNEFSCGIKNIALAKRNESVIGEWGAENIDDDGILIGRWYDANEFASEAFFNFMLCEAGVIHNKEYVKAFMKENGFKNVTIKRAMGKSGRENVWIVKGIKA